MKRLIVVGIFLLALAVPVFADAPTMAGALTVPTGTGNLTVLPNATGVLTMYDFGASKTGGDTIKVGVRYPVVNWADWVYLDAAAITDSKFSITAFGLGISADVIALLRKTGANISLPMGMQIGGLYACGWNKDTSHYGPIPVFGPWIGLQWSW